MVGQLLEFGSLGLISNRPGKSNATDTFSRIEDKFFIPRSRGPELIATLKNRLDSSYPDSATQFNLIESLYFDSGKLDIYRSHFESLDRRFKVRVRRYASNGVWKDDSVHLELKMKEKGVSKKVRFKIGPNECSLLSLGHRIPLSIELMRRNPKQGAITLLKRIAKMNAIIARYGLRPQCRVTYMRQAFERDGLRVTLDDQIRYQILSPIDSPTSSRISRSPAWEKASLMRNNFLRADHLVVEVKHAGTIPSWLQEFLAATGASKMSFSKYCFTMSEHMSGAE
jgi:SPX domain protein involved in polyphosphate accumulation